MGRPKKTVVLVFAEADYKAFAETEKLYTNKSNIQTRTRVIREFLSSCDVNNLGLGPALRPWVGAQRRSGVAWSSLDTFCGYIYGTLAGRINLSDVPEWDNICSVVAAAHADSTTKSALTATDAQLRQLKEELNDDVFWVVSAVRYTGTRMADIRRWRRRQVCFAKKNIHVEVRVTKGRRARKKRRILSIATNEIFGLQTPANLRLPLRKLQPDDLVTNLTTSAVNRALKAACKKLKIPTCTTYSFRHLYIKNVLAYCPSSTRCTVVRTFWPPTRIGQLDGIQHKV
jgi:hypothetical protein